MRLPAGRTCVPWIAEGTAEGLSMARTLKNSLPRQQLLPSNSSKKHEKEQRGAASFLSPGMQSTYQRTREAGGEGGKGWACR